LRAICGLQPIRSGRVCWEGRILDGLAPHERARARLALVPQGREIFPRLTVSENLTTGFAPLPPNERALPGEIFTLFPSLKDMLHRHGGDLSRGQQQLAIARALVTRPRLLILDEPTEGIQPSIIKEIERVIRAVAERGNMAILLVEQYFDFARGRAACFSSCSAAKSCSPAAARRWTRVPSADISPCDSTMRGGRQGLSSPLPWV